MSETPEPDVIVVDAPQESRLEQLTAQYDLLKEQADAAAEALKSCVDGIKAELAALVPDSESTELRSPHLDRPLRLDRRTSWRMDTKALKQNAPEVYVRYAKQVTSWVLTQIGPKS